VFLVTGPISLRRGINSLRVSFRRGAEIAEKSGAGVLSAKQVHRNLLRKQDFPRPFNESPVNKGFGPVDSLWERCLIWLRLLALFGLRAFVRERFRFS
jgi:hypothetical protein